MNDRLIPEERTQLMGGICSRHGAFSGGPCPHCQSANAKADRRQRLAALKEEVVRQARAEGEAWLRWQACPFDKLSEERKLFNELSQKTLARMRAVDALLEEEKKP